MPDFDARKILDLAAHIIAIAPPFRLTLERLPMPTADEFLADLTARLDRIEHLVQAETDQQASEATANAAKDAEIADLRKQLDAATAAGTNSVSIDKLQPIIDKLAVLEGKVPNIVPDQPAGGDAGTGTGDTGTGTTPPDTGTDSGSPTEPPTGDQPVPLTSIGLSSPDNGPDNATA